MWAEWVSRSGWGAGGEATVPRPPGPVPSWSSDALSGLKGNTEEFIWVQKQAFIYSETCNSRSLIHAPEAEVFTFGVNLGKITLQIPSCFPLRNRRNHTPPFTHVWHSSAEWTFLCSWRAVCPPAPGHAWTPLSSRHVGTELSAWPAPGRRRRCAGCGP